MSRSKLRSVADVCGDCGALDPTWASINRGILLCDECCSVHRSLGIHISRVKSLRLGHWHPAQLHMVQTLHNHGANSIWEHSLLDPTHSKSGRKKPQPKDPVHPAKADFIRAKHQMLAFVYRPSREEGPLLSEDADLSRQLHSSVRTANLETSLRMLAQGADANFFHPDKGTCPLHVAAKEGQGSQAELLLVYGADPNATDTLGNTAADLARNAGHVDLAHRLSESAYELTDTLAYYICQRVPDHKKNVHFIVPAVADNMDPPELAKAARRKLQGLPNNLFEELAMDVYDEVDRRENEAAWAATQLPTNPTIKPIDRSSMVPFLPVNTELSATRNQGRQKLARLNKREFAMLIIDILSDARRRQAGTVSMIILPQGESHSTKAQNIISGGRPCRSEVSDDEPLYDSVASDEDYVTAASLDTLSALSAVTSIAQSSSDEKESSTSAKLTLKDAQINLAGSNENKINTSSTEELLKKQLELSEARLDSMSVEIRTLQATVAQLMQDKGKDDTPLQFQVDTLIAENNHLRNIIAQAGLNTMRPQPGLTNGFVEAKSPRNSVHQRPVSMYEPRTQSQQGLFSSLAANSPITGSYSKLSSIEVETWKNSDEFKSKTALPDKAEIRNKTDLITKRIQELVSAMLENKRDSFLSCSVKIRSAVSELCSMFPQAPEDEFIRLALQQLNTSTLKLQTECQTLTNPDGTVENLIQKIRSCAYEIAKATKLLVTRFQD